MNEIKTTEFEINKTDIEGLLDIDITVVEDERGWFQERYQKEKLEEAGFPKDFVPVQQNISFNKHVGTTRGIHAEPWNKYVSVTFGQVYAVFVDLRKGNNFGKKVEIVIDPSKAVYVPKDVANSFQTLTHNTLFTYLVDGHWSADGEYKTVNLADPKLDIKWPIPLNIATVSEKDRNAPLLDKIK